MKDLRYRFEGAALWLAFLFFRCLPTETASDIGGWIGRTVGPRLAASRKAFVNLRLAFPEKTESDHADIVVKMWDNLGRVIAEYPHLEDIIMNRTEIIGGEYMRDLGKDERAIIIGGHIGNWELLPFYFNYRIDWPMAGIYRAPNNPYVEKLLDKCRNPIKRGSYIPKSTKGARQIIKTLQDGGRLGVLIDQKYNQGIAVPFFGRLAMTSSAFAQLSLKYDCPILPLHAERLNGCHFKISMYPLFKTEGMNETDVVIRANRILEGWIREKPEQWLWLHRRWDSKALKDKPAP